MFHVEVTRWHPATEQCNCAGVPEDRFGEDVAARYDENSASMFEPDVLGPTVDVLAGLAGDGAAIEFTVGTGKSRVAARSSSVCPCLGSNSPSPWQRELRAKDVAERIKVTIGDMATTRVAGGFQPVYLVFNTIGNLTTQDQQGACFANAAAHLEPGGYFLIEVVCSRPAPPPARRRRPCVLPRPGLPGLRPLHRPRRPAGHVAPLLRRRVSCRAGSRRRSGTCGHPSST